MAQVPNSSLVPYITAADFLQCYSQRLVSDLPPSTPQSPPPSYLNILDQTSVAGSRLYFHLQEGAGEIEAHCSASLRYTPDDLKALVGVGQILLEKLNAARAFWSLNQYLKPLTARPQDVPGATESFELLKMLRDGIAIFPRLETQQAGEGLPVVTNSNPAALKTPNVVGMAVRLFPNYGLNRLRNSGGSS